MTDGVLADYETNGYYCELFGGGTNAAEHAALIRRRIDGMRLAGLRRRARAAERELFNVGITFTVYAEKDAIDRILPFDVIPRVLSPAEWRTVEDGVVQRVTAMNLFLDDVYHEQKILKDGVVPRELILGNAHYCPEMAGHDLPHGTYIHVCGIDIVRDEHGRFLVLEDNGRTPSGVSYVIENRYLMQRAFSDLMSGIGVRGVSEYGLRLTQAMREIAPPGADEPQVVLLTPGVYNSAYFEHVFLAREMGVPLVEGRDLVVEDDRVFMKTAAGLSRVDVIYRRLNDSALDPEAFDPATLLGVPGLMRIYLSSPLIKWLFPALTPR